MNLKRVLILLLTGTIIFAPLAPLTTMAQQGETVWLPFVPNDSADATPDSARLTTAPRSDASSDDTISQSLVSPSQENRPATIQSPLVDSASASASQQRTSSGMPSRPAPAVPVPHHKPGRPAKVGHYSTEVTEVTAAGVEETFTLSGLDAMLADGVIPDPLAGNYTMVNLDKILMSSVQSGQLSLQTYGVTDSPDTPPQIEAINTSLDLGAHPAHDITAGDLNGDGQAEQIAVWISDTNKIWMSIGEMPGSLGRTTSAPAAVTHDDGTIDLLVRGYDETLWHRQYKNDAWQEWNNDAGGLLLSAPTIASAGDGSFDAFVIDAKNQVQHRHWNGSSWTTNWAVVRQDNDWAPLEPWFGPTPDLPAPAAIERNGNLIDIFRLAPDNTLRWSQFDGSAWRDWENLGGMLASGPGAVSTGPTHMQVFARGVDEALWSLEYDNGWQTRVDGSYLWQRIEMPEGVTITSRPAAIWKDGLTNLYVRGSDDQLWHNKSENRWGEWESKGGNLASGVAVANGSMIVAQVVDGSLWHMVNDTDWEFWSDLPHHGSNSFDTGLTVADPNYDRLRYWSVDVEIGDFLGRGQQQIAIAYYSGNHQVTVSLLQIADGFSLQLMPDEILSVPLDKKIQWFRITSGSITDANGNNEIAVIYARDDSYGVDLIQVVNGQLASRAVKEPETIQVWDGDDHEKPFFQGTLDITAGDLDADGQDEIAVLSVWTIGDYIHNQESWIFKSMTRIYDSQQGGFEEYYVEYDNWRETLKDGNFHSDTIGLAISTGDFDGDGDHELLRTWPKWFANDHIFEFERRLQILQLTGNATEWDMDDDNKIDKEKRTIKNLGSDLDEDGSPFWAGQGRSYLDHVTAGDLDRDLVDEIIWLTSPDSGEFQLYAFGHRDNEYQELDTTVFSNAIADAKLVTGDFTREGIHVGTPSYRLQNRVDTLVAVVHMPPKHRDIVMDAEGEYRLIESPQGECNPSPDSPDCTHAKHGTLALETSEQTIQTVHAYQISAGHEAEACAGGGVEGVASVKACVRTSINASHGGNFEKSTDKLDSIGFRRKVVAANDDKIVYFGTPYHVWEYPVLAGGLDDEAPYITVAFPVQKTTQYPDTSGGYVSGACDERWFHADHQPNNVWSYDPIGDVTFADYGGEDRYLVYDVIEGDWAEGEITFEKLESAFGSVEFQHAVSARLETEVSAEAKIKVVDVSANFKSHVQGDYSNSHLKTDRLTTSDETTFSYFLAPQPDTAKYTTRVLFYRAVDNYQVLNYQAEPGRSIDWQLYDKPDPAFILPWYGFPNPDDPIVPPCGEAQKLYSPAISLDRAYAEVGESVTISATVRNFSNETARDVIVRFCHGDSGEACRPGGSAYIDESDIDLLRRPDGPVTVSVDWNAEGAGAEKIYAIIDPDDTIPEVHDGDDLIDNNIGYASIQIGAAADADMGQSMEQPYDAVHFKMDDAGSHVSFHSPRASLNAVTRFELRNAAVSPSIDGSMALLPFELVAYQGSKFQLWSEPIPDFRLRQEESDPPAVIMIDNENVDLANLNLFRLEGRRWVDALCDGYDVYYFQNDDLLAVPICQSGIFALSDRTLPPVNAETTYLPFVAKPSTLPPLNQTDLVPLQLRVEPATGLDTQSDVTLSVMLQNQGNIEAAANFWVDLFINPSRPPNKAGDIWSTLCSEPDACGNDLGLAWQVTKPLAPGEIITLTSDAGNPYLHAGQTQWAGHFNRSGEQTLWAYVDVWNGEGAPNGWITESSEINNRLGPVSVDVDSAAVGAAETMSNTHDVIPPRPNPTR